MMDALARDRSKPHAVPMPDGMPRPRWLKLPDDDNWRRAMAPLTASLNEFKLSVERDRKLAADVDYAFHNLRPRLDKIERAASMRAAAAKTARYDGSKGRGLNINELVDEFELQT